jgi:hypothetical protein
MRPAKVLQWRANETRARDGGSVHEPHARPGPCCPGAQVPLSVAAPALSGAVIQRAEQKVKKGTPATKGWTFLRTEGAFDVYDDGADLMELEPTRKFMPDNVDPATLSDPELSETEIDPDTTPLKVYRTNNIRDAMKLKRKVLDQDPNANVGTRVGGGTVFRLEGKGTQYYVKHVDAKKLKRKGIYGTGATPKRAKTDRAPTGKQGSYEHFASELLDYPSKDVGQAIYDKFIAKPSVAYPAKFSERAQSMMDEMFGILSIAEVYRTEYALPLFVAAVNALKQGESLKDVLYKGKGQLEALHPGASSYSDSGISGQLMEQNLGFGENKPHPTQKSMNISDDVFVEGAARTRKLFEKASVGTTPEAMLKTDILPHFTVGVQGIDASVKTASFGRWSADLAVGLKPGKTLKIGSKVQYKGKNYTVNNQTPSGYYRLFDA